MQAAPRPARNRGGGPRAAAADVDAAAVGAAAFGADAAAFGAGAAAVGTDAASELERNLAQQRRVLEGDARAFASDRFWAGVAEATPGLADDARYARCRGFVRNLRGRERGKITSYSGGQELLDQYTFPGLPPRSEGPFPAAPPAPHAAWAVALAAAAAGARSEVDACLDALPPGFPDGGALGASGGDTAWARAAWPGWEYLDLRHFEAAMPLTSRALKRLPLGHRFVGLARQKAQSAGPWHSDHRNYVLSTITGVRVPPGLCGVYGSSANGVDRRTLADGETLYLDNSFPHRVYNDADAARVVLIAEVYHPALLPAEKRFLDTVFAAVDRFQLLEGDTVPAGVGDDDLRRGLADGSVYTIDFYRRLRPKARPDTRSAPGPA
ncbi:hypothetical protein M885DRAFT_453093 [Pelagophyceae sp. CCMP2097]|nr:hypothetical protein M885DRAFT_453093 [Pelagophyceae sp. CCMP2097]